MKNIKGGTILIRNGVRVLGSEVIGMQGEKVLPVDLESFGLIINEADYKDNLHLYLQGGGVITIECDDWEEEIQAWTKLLNWQ